MKKRKGLILGLFSVFIIIAIIVVIVNLNNENNTEEPSEDSKTSYATSFSLNIPNTINVLKGNNVELITGFANITPAEKVNEIKATITSSENNSGLTFIDNVIKAVEVGEYTIKFSVPRSAKTYFTKSINVIVYEDEADAHITQTTETITVGEIVPEVEVFTINSNLEFCVSTDALLSFADGNFTSNEVGTSLVTYTFDENYLKYSYTFNLTIKEKPQYTIVLNNVTNNTIEINMAEKSTFSINYSLLNRAEENVYQDLLATSNNENIVEVNWVAEPYIKITAMKAGETILTLTCEDDTAIFIEIKVVVK